MNCCLDVRHFPMLCNSTRDASYTAFNSRLTTLSDVRFVTQCFDLQITMSNIVQKLRRLLRPPASPIQFPSTGFRALDNSLCIEEERGPWYTSTTFYPAKIGEVLQSRYQIVGKLGYGGYSTVWLCRDLVSEVFSEPRRCVHAG